MAKINWTKEAEDWLKIIFNYIAEDNNDAAVRLVTAIYRKAEILNDFPLIGYKLHDWPDRHIRVLLYGHYRIAYLIRDEENIDILGVFHGSLNLDKYLPKE
ncbi:MAG: type II toxin-antitoxin system RelE/ParE family toxin [Nitrospiraceae bacterium]|nr:MAG: type II toxin-antitoxin system RelE/ParE family toxin [Nitrospiraceae bacterium]